MKKKNITITLEKYYCTKYILQIGKLILRASLCQKQTRPLQFMIMLALMFIS